ncbi:MAG: cupin domain-containing protein, partial [Chloroflexota bacterium]|nr:cupin domain-containing protein [Chloroflexota bacterium]
RVGWLAHLTGEVSQTLKHGVDLQGICLYPVISSPDWEDPTAFFDGGEFDAIHQPDGKLKRVIASDVAKALHSSQQILDPDNTINISDPSMPIEEPEPVLSTFAFAQPLQTMRFKSDNFSYQTLIVGENVTVEVYGFEPGGSLPAHRHNETEHVLTILSGTGDVRIGDKWINMREGESVLIPARLYHGIHNYATERLVVQQVSAPKPWDARFAGPAPAGSTE